MAVASLFVLAAVGLIALGMLGGAVFLIARGISKQSTGVLVAGIALLLIPCLLGSGLSWLFLQQRTRSLRPRSEDTGITPPTPIEQVTDAAKPLRTADRTILEFRLEATESVAAEWKRTGVTPEGFLATTVPGAEKQEILFVQRPALDAGDVVGATESVDSMSGTTVEVIFNEPGKSALAAVTREAANRRLGIFYRGRLLSSPMIREPILGGRAVISGRLSRSEVEDLLTAFRH